MTLSFSIDLVLLFLCIPFPSTAAPNSLSDIQVGFENFLTAFYDGKGGWDWRRFAWNYIRRWHPATQQFWPDTCPCTSGKPKDVMARRRSWVQMVQDFSLVRFCTFCILPPIDCTPREHRTVMLEAMGYITSKSPCVTFVPATKESINYVVIHTGPSCASEVGMQGRAQVLFMNEECFNEGLTKPVHELLHAAGFVHEHIRKHWC